MAAVLAGDVEQFAILVSRYQVAIRKLCRGYIFDEMLAEDIAQDAFLKAYRKLKTYDQSRSFRNWMFTIAGNLAKDAWRSKQRQKKLIDGIRVLIPSRSEDVFSDKDLVRKCLEKLSVEEREVLILREYLELSYEEMATQLCISVDAVKGKLKRARKSFDVQAISKSA